MILEEVFAKYGIELRNSDGSLRNMIDVLEDMYLHLGPRDFNKLTYELSEEEKYSNIFDQARNRYYRGKQ